MSQRGQYFTVPVDVASQPRTGDAVCGEHWLVDADGSLIVWSPKPLCDLDPDAPFFEVFPQCNPDPRVANALLRTVPGAHAASLVPVVFSSSVRSHARELARRLRDHTTEDAPRPGTPSQG